MLERSRGRGVGTALLERLSAWAVAAGQTHANASVDELDDASLTWASRRGFREVGRNSALVLDLRSAPRPEISPPDGVAITSWADRPDAVRGMYEVSREAYVDVPGEEETEMAPFEEWVANDLDGASDRPEATFVASPETRSSATRSSRSPKHWQTPPIHDITAVKRAWRGRGVAGALKRAEIAWAIDSGYVRLQTFNEVRNEPIRRLNERYGYVVEPGTIRVRGSSAPPSTRGRRLTPLLRLRPTVAA